MTTQLGRRLVLGFLLGGTACTVLSVADIENAADATLDREARALIDYLGAGNVGAAHDLFEAKMHGTTLSRDLANVVSALGGTSLEVTLTGVSRESVGGLARTTHTYYLATLSGTFLFAVSRNERAAGLFGLGVDPVSETVSVRHGFTLANKTVAHYTVLVAGVLSLIVCVSCFVLGLVSPRLIGGRLWSIAALVTAPTFAINWSTGESATGIAILFGVFATRATEYHPWTIGFGVPLGALVVWLRYHRSKRQIE